jgi:hypothetical protein
MPDAPEALRGNLLISPASFSRKDPTLIGRDEVFLY